MSEERLAAIRASTQGVYQRKAAHYARDRSQALSEKPWLDRFLAALPDRPSLLDLGCGTGQPVAAYLSAKGARVTGIDYAPAMVERARASLPEGDWYVADMRDLPDVGVFDGVYSWDGFFHLSPDEQRASLPAIAACVAPGGTLMLTVGPDEGEVTGWIAGEAVYHGSLSPDEYAAILSGCGFDTVSDTPEAMDLRGRHVLFATCKTALCP